MSSLKYKLTRRYGMHIAFGIIALISCLRLNAQTYIPGAYYGIGLSQWAPLPAYKPIEGNSISNQKWFLSKYTAISAGTVFYPGGGNAFVISAPIGLQLNRQLTNNLYAFAGVYMAPTYATFNHAFINSPMNQSYPGNLSNPYSFGINPGVQMGLQYVNDAGTFSISGSVRMERSSYPVYAPPPASSNTKRQ
ncbi:MAG TPA: hypothetical protein VMI12_03340 [Puia sp.]|nr:hypothetical protein [Puia sp.]